MARNTQNDCIQLSCRAVQCSPLGAQLWAVEEAVLGARVERGEGDRLCPPDRGREAKLGQEREVGRRKPWVTLPERQKPA